MTLVDEKLVIAMVGLPARGKSYISRAIIRYLNFLGCQVRLFNAGNLRRDSGQAGVSSDFFNPHNEEAKQQRERMAMQCLDDTIEFLKSVKGCVSVGILDATNTTIERRSHVFARVAQEPGISLLFLESICEDDAVLQENYRLKLKNADYDGADACQAQADFMKRVKQYEQAYQPVEDVEDGVARSYIKIIDAGRKLVKCRGSDPRSKSDVVPKLVFDLLGSLHLGTRTIFLMVVAPSENDVKGVLGGDTGLAPLGKERARALRSFLCAREAEEKENAQVICGTHQRHLETVALLKKVGCGGNRTRRVLKLQRMNEMCVGTFDNMSMSEIEELYPEEAESRRKDKLNYRYPGEGGESYQDLVSRMHEHILRLEQYQGSTVVICDKRVCRVLLAYFRDTPLKDMPYMKVPTELVELERSHSGFHEKLHSMPWRGRVSGLFGPGTPHPSMGTEDSFDVSMRTQVSMD